MGVIMDYNVLYVYIVFLDVGFLGGCGIFRRMWDF